MPSVKFDLDRVMTVSFHKFGDLFFPGTGDVKVFFMLSFVHSVSAMVIFFNIYCFFVCFFFLFYRYYTI